MQTQEQIENLQTIQNPDVETVHLDSPFKIGGQEIKSVEVRKPSVIALRKVRIADILNGDVNSICTLLPLCTTNPTLTKQQLDTLIDPVDIIQMGGAIITFFATEISTCGNCTPTVEDAMANIAVVFHWPPQAFEDMSLSELMQWHQKAIERNGSDAE